MNKSASYVLQARLSIKYVFTRVMYIIQNWAVFPCSLSNVCWMECSYDSMRCLYSCDPSVISSGPGHLFNFNAPIQVESSWLIGPNFYFYLFINWCQGSTFQVATLTGNLGLLGLLGIGRGLVWFAVIAGSRFPHPRGSRAWDATCVPS